MEARTWQPFGPLIETTLRVATWNLWWRFGEWETRQPAIVDTLRRIDADIVLLQEVWEDDAHSQAQQLAEALELNHVFHPWTEMDDVQFGNAVLSRWPMAGSTYLPYSVAADGGRHRGAIRADIDGPRGPIQIFTTHLSWRFDEGAERCQQVLELLQFVKDSPQRSYPALIGGDFNAEASSDEIQMMTGRHRASETATTMYDAWEFTDEPGPGWTWDDQNPVAAAGLEPNRRIDYIFAGWPRAGGAGNVVDVRVERPLTIDGNPASDHSAVVAELRY